MLRGKHRAGRAVARGAGFALGFAGAFALLLAALDRGGVERSRTVLDEMERLVGQVAQLASRSPAPYDLALVGDSHVLRIGTGAALDDRIERSLRPRREGATVWRVAGNGLSPFVHYALCDSIAAARPDGIVVQLNLAHFSGAWQRIGWTPLAALIEPARWLEAMSLPLYRVGVSLDRLIAWGVLRQLGGLPAWRRLGGLQSRVRQARYRLADGLQAASPWPDGLRYQRDLVLAELRRIRAPGTRRASRAWVRQVLGPALDGVDADHPTLQLLDASLARYQEAGIPVLVFVNPINVEHLESLGLDDEAGLARTLARAEAVVRSRNAGWLDLHDLLPDAAFRDEMDHLDPGSEAQGAERLAQRLVEALAP